MRPELVHLATGDEGRVSPLCGRWGESNNWTLARAVSTCPDCRAASEQLDGIVAAPPISVRGFPEITSPFGELIDRRST
jgi:hypothetical protein